LIHAADAWPSLLLTAGVVVAFGVPYGKITVISDPCWRGSRRTSFCATAA
jgi:hypothetical protein